MKTITKEDKYNESFGYQWKTYNDTQTGFKGDKDFWKKRIEYTLGMPLEILKNMSVLEIGCGAGRFTVPLSKYAKHVTAVDMSDAINHSHAKDIANVRLVKADLFDKELDYLGKYDLVICRGVIQHTPEPELAIDRLFDFVDDDGLVVFDVYKKRRFQIMQFKYFFRSWLPRLVKYDKFDKFSRKNRDGLYFLSQLSNRMGLIPLFNILWKRTPLYYPENLNQNLQATLRL